MDPRVGYIKINEKSFINGWYQNGKGIIAFFEPIPNFHDKLFNSKSRYEIFGWKNILYPLKWKFIILSILILFNSIIIFYLPFLSKELIDNGLNLENNGIIINILLAQIFLHLGSLLINIYRNWLTLFIGSNFNIKIINKFINKLIKLPLKHFEYQKIGDLNQRILDNEKIENIVSSEGINLFFSIISIIIFSIILIYFNIKIFIIYIILSSFSLLWSIIWINKLKKYDFEEFEIKSKNQDSIYEIFTGIRDLKLFNFEKYQLKKWENIQRNLFNLNLKKLKINQIQFFGFQFITQIKNTLIIYLCCLQIIQNNLTFGTLMSISFILGELNLPLSQLINLFKKIKEALLSYERLVEVSILQPEEKPHLITYKSEGRNDIQINNLSFCYEYGSNNKIIDKINFKVENSKITAIVGKSGSGKTTILKLLLKFLNPTFGEILVEGKDLSKISPISYRNEIGVVLQDGFIFSDSIIRNIVTCDENIDFSNFKNSIKMACIDNFIDSLPQKENTIIGASGINMSTGQRQRILLARAIYKNPKFLFLDEPTSALDANTENLVMDNLKKFFINKTVIIIAHRLSTIKNADKIIVLDSGKIVEIGSHVNLIKKKGYYYNLINDQI